MNKYRVTTFSYGSSYAFIVLGFDIVNAIQNSGANQSEIVLVEFIGSANETDLTKEI